MKNNTKKSLAAGAGVVAGMSLTHAAGLSRANRMVAGLSVGTAASMAVGNNAKSQSRVTSSANRKNTKTKVRFMGRVPRK